MSNNNSSNNNNRGGKNGKNGGFRGVLTLIAWALVLTVAFQYFNAYNNNAANKSTSHEIKYSDMISMIEKDQVKEILFKDSTIYITALTRVTPGALSLRTRSMPCDSVTSESEQPAHAPVSSSDTTPFSSTPTSSQSPPSA